MHAVCETAHAESDGHSCHRTDGIQHERVNGTNYSLIGLCIFCFTIKNLFTKCKEILGETYGIINGEVILKNKVFK